MNETVLVLIVEDNPADVDLVREYLLVPGSVRFEIESVSRLSEALARLSEKRMDLLLIDLGLPDSQGLETFLKLQKAVPEIPAIILTGNDDEETAAIAVRKGAQDYIIKGEIVGNTLVRAARYAVERKRVEEALKESERELKAIFEALPIGISILNTEHKIVSVNPALEKILDLSKKSLLSGDYVGRTYIKSTGERMLSKEFASAQALSGDVTVQDVETGIVKEDGSLIWTSVSAVPVNISDWKAVLITSDITERKQAQARLQLAHDVLAILNRREGSKEIIRDILQMVEKSTGVEAVGLRLRDGDDFPYYQTSGFPDHFVELERSLCAHDEAGRLMRDSEGNVILACMCGNVIRGRTDPKQPFFTPGGSFWSNGTTDLLASTTEEDRQARTRNRCNGEGYESVALIPLRSNGDIIGLLQLNDHRRNQFTLEMIQFFEGLSASIGIALSRKRAEEGLRDSEEKYRALVENANETVIVAQDGFHKFVNQKAVEMTGYSEEELLSRPFLEFIYPDDREMVMNNYRKRIAGETAQSRYVFRYLNREGGFKWVETGSSVLIDWEGRPATLNFLTDVTDRLKAEEVIQASLREKEVMLREIHHRVKNNMQVISSLFNIQAGKTANAEYRDAVKQGQARIRAMSLVHEKLYQSHDLSRIDLAIYIQSLADHLLNIYLTDSNRIRLEPDLEEVSLDINSAVPCGLILNELISNSLKHAFPEGRKGLIRIGLKRGPDDLIILRVADDGIGFPKDVDFLQSESVGLQISNLLVGQLEGTIELDRTNGTTFTLTFRELKYAPRI